MTTYLDSSAIVKLAVREPESAALRRYLRRRRPPVSSALARTEVLRALLSAGSEAVARGRSADIRPLPIWDGVIARAVEGLEMTRAVVELAPNSHVAAHQHLNEQIGIVLKGTLTFTIMGSSGRWALATRTRSRETSVIKRLLAQRAPW